MTETKLRRRNKSKANGTKAETAVARFLAANGFPHAEKRRQTGARDQGDITGTPGICWEVKTRNRPVSDEQVTAWLAETETERINAGADVGVLVVRRAGVGDANAGRWWAVLRLWTVLWVQSQADRDVTGAPAYTGGADLFEVGASDPATPWMYAPVRLLLADAVTLLRAAGYGNPVAELEVTG